MAIKSYKPTTAARRQMTVTDYSQLSKVAPEKSLVESLKTNSGRNKNPVVIATVESQYVTEAAETEENTVSSILNVQNTAFQLLYKH